MQHLMAWHGHTPNGHTSNGHPNASPIMAPPSWRPLHRPPSAAPPHPKPRPHPRGPAPSPEAPPPGPPRARAGAGRKWRGGGGGSGRERGAKMVSAEGGRGGGTGSGGKGPGVAPPPQFPSLRGWRVPHGLPRPSGCLAGRWWGCAESRRRRGLGGASGMAPGGGPALLRGLGSGGGLAEQRGTIPAFSLLTTLLLVQHGVWVGFWAVIGSFRLMSSFSSTSTPSPYVFMLIITAVMHIITAVLGVF